MDERLGTKAKIDIILKEYEGLRAEILMRTSSGYQIAAIGGLVLTWLLTQTMDAKFWGLLGAFAVIFLLASVQTLLTISRLAQRVRWLEFKINKLAGERLLTWESRHGGDRTLMLFRITRLAIFQFKTLTREANEPR